MPIYVSAREHSDGLMREFQLIAMGDPQAVDVPHRLVQLASQLSANYSSFGAAAQELLAEAEAAGTPQIDLTYHLPAALAAATAELSALLDEADRFCAGGEYLLTLVTPPEALAFRRWFIDEIVRQISAEAPTSWPDWLATHPIEGPAPEG
ncbi:MAG: hypothetical protein ACRDJU_00480 [Actinomycetota bacterium]